MKRPSLFTYLIGNPISAPGLVGFGGYLIYHWWIGLANNGVLIVAVILMSMAGTAGNQLIDYYQWKRNWNAMAGVSHAARWRWLRMPAVCLAWVVGAVGLSHLDTHRPETGFAMLGFALATMLMIVIMLRRLWRRWRFRHPGRRKHVLVTISLRVPRASPGPQQFYKGVPAYCARVS